MSTVELSGRVALITGASRGIGYGIAEALLARGDRVCITGRNEDALKEAVEYFRAVNPAVAIPIHEKVMANPAMVYGLLTRLAPADAKWLNLDDGHFENL
jgi:NAD(P)-dependent dehydrogenase (short-subunit alcohol dehydrogenase family)